MTLKIKFLGATGTVTGSRYLLQSDETCILIDCGMFQGLKQLRLRNWEPFPVDPKTISAVILTHAHLDHSGYLPRLVKMGFEGPVFASTGTHALCNILLPDAAHLQEEDAKFLNANKLSKHEPALPLYTGDDAKHALTLIKPVSYNDVTSFGPFSFRFFPISHLLGASCIEIKTGGKTVLFSGDVGRTNDPILQEPVDVAKTDYLIVESTYGNRLHPNTDVKPILADIINKTIKRHGTVLIPTFAVGRSQALIQLINLLKHENKIPDVPVFLDSPMAVEATKAHLLFADELKMNREELTKALSNVQYITRGQQSQMLSANRTPKIILSSSGMITGGRILHHMKAFGPDPKNSIVLAGFQAAGTRGELLMSGKRELKIHGDLVPINAEVHAIQNLSGHADYEGILAWLKKFDAPPSQTFVTHGEPVASTTMRQHISSTLGWNVRVPEYLETVTL